MFLSTALVIFKFDELNYDKVYYLSRYGALYEELKTTRRIYMMYHPFFLLNRTIISFTLIFLVDNFFIQLCIMITSQFCVSSY